MSKTILGLFIFLFSFFPFFTYNIVTDGDELYNQLSTEDFEECTRDDTGFQPNNGLKVIFDPIPQIRYKARKTLFGLKRGDGILQALNSPLNNHQPMPHFSSFISHYTPENSEIMDEEFLCLAAEYNVDDRWLSYCTSLTTKHLKDFKAIFDYIDDDSSNSISTDEVLALLKRINSQFGKQEIQKFMQNADLDGNGELDFGEFLVMMAGSLSLQFNKKSLKKCFATFATVDDCNMIDVQELRTILTSLHCITSHAKLEQEYQTKLMENMNTDRIEVNAEVKDNFHSFVAKKDIEQLLSTLPVNENGLLDIDAFLDNVL